MTASLQPGRNYPRRILAVDDDPVVREFLSLYLAMDGVQVDTLEDGDTVIDRLSDGYDILILDLEMPRVSGFDVLRALGAAGEASRPPVIVLTSRTDASAITEAFELGAAAYLLKPVPQQALTAKVSAVYMAASL